MPPRKARSTPRRVRQAARAAGLTYVSDTGAAGIARKGRPSHFRYVGPAGKTIRDAATLRRIRALAIPPAWREVWIASSAKAHLQATGRDARGRKQYRYHPAFAAMRGADKYAHLISFAEQLPALRRRLKADLGKPGLPREKILAAVVVLLEETLIRIGNEDYVQANHSYGLTTLHNRHVRVRGAALRFVFTGKSGKRWDLSLQDRRVARVVGACQELPGQHLFEYRGEDGAVHPISSTDVNAYLREITGADVTAKDFRTWAGTVMAAIAFSRQPAPATRKAVRAVVGEVAARLGNTVAVCRKCYIHPAIIQAFEKGRLGWGSGSATTGLRAAEHRVLALLRAAERKRRSESC
jgi:DNA topoisomerase I